MNTELLEEAKKCKISTRKYAYIRLPIDDCSMEASAKELIEAISAFLKQYNLDDAKFTIQLGGYDSYLEGVNLSSNVNKTEEEIKEEIKQFKEREADKKRVARENKKKREIEERKEYARLQKKYD